ncbi:MAG: 2OG-Fe(II) oxygenase [Pseudomonadota bacterium]|nr:2OG-Fe(II) oxygenase [Pseudomonadota bacterium]
MTISQSLPRQLAPQQSGMSEKLSPAEVFAPVAGAWHLKRQTLDLLGRPVASEILLMDDFLSNRDCDLILEELDFALWWPSLTYMLQEDGARRNVLSPYRVSETAQQKWFSDELQAMAAGIEGRFETLFDLDVANLEYWQATNYPDNGGFYYHLDAGYWETHYAGDRILTLLLYLTTPREGGGTHFRALDVQVEAKAGRLVVWNNLFPNGNCNHRMIHSSMPLLEGKKTTLITWLRQKKFRIHDISSTSEARGP